MMMMMMLNAFQFVCGDRLEGIMVMSASLFHTLSLSLFGSINLCDGVHWHIECSNAMTNICRIFSRMDCSAIAIVFNSLYYQHTIPHPYIYIYTKTLHCDYKQLCCASTRRPNSRKKTCARNAQCSENTLHYATVPNVPKYCICILCI